MKQPVATPVLAFSDHAPIELSVFRYVSPETDCLYPFLAATRDRSTSLLLGNYEACFELVPSGETRRWLPGFASMRMRVPLELAGLCELAEHVCLGSVDCGIVQFGQDLRVSGLKLVLTAESAAKAGQDEVAYVIHAFSRYERVGRDVRYRVGAVETALLHMCCATFAPFAQRMPHLLREPPPPRSWLDLAAAR